MTRETILTLALIAFGLIVLPTWAEKTAGEIALTCQLMEC